MKKKGTAAAVILAAGSGTRFGGAKQLETVAGLPVVIRSLRAFASSPLVDEIVLVVSPGCCSSYEALCAKHGIEKLKCVVEGGGCRMDSAIRGMEAISDSVKYIAVHDAARCLVTLEMIADVFAAAYMSGAAIAATHARDTLKAADQKDTVTETVPRENIWCAATPQIFEANLYRAAAYVAQRDALDVTDDASMVEHIGRGISLVDTGSSNIKITYPEDIAIAEAILRFRKEGTV